jgi:uncharacterized repeat protein (TIGR01451 family)
MGTIIRIKKSFWIPVVVLLVGVFIVFIGMVSSATTSVAVYNDALSPDWADWSWDTTVDPANSSPVHNGSASLAVTYTDAWVGLYLHANALDISGEDTLHFWLHGGTSGGQKISIGLNKNGYTYEVTAVAGTWQEYEIPLTAFGSPGTVSDLIFQENAGAAQSTFYLDEIAFVNNGLPPPTPVPPGDGPDLSVDVAADRQPISPYIYGMNFTDEDLADDLGLPVRRRGGNSTTRYNWQTDVHNTGADWYYENIPNENGYGASLPDGSSADLFVEQNNRTGTETIMTMPLIGWTPKVGAASHPYDCGFSIDKYNYNPVPDPSRPWMAPYDDPWDTDCGSGFKQGSSGAEYVTGNNPLDTSVTIDPSFVTAWINHLTGKYGTADNGGVMFYSLDNEPMIWSSTHRDVHPNGTTYDELRDKTYAYASAVKAADPSAKTMGPVVWGWCTYFYSGADGCSAGVDHAAHGDTDFVEWYLQQMNLYEQQNGVRILDYLDVHSYPYANGVTSQDLGNADLQAVRLRSTRSLWDPTYLDESWVGRDLGGYVQTIPRMKQWVADNYPGTKTAITEYSWGAYDYMNGALAQADVLGIFGREGLDLATLWGPPDFDQPAAYAFRMYLNYDGSGSGFGDTRVQAASTDQEQLAIYGAQRSTDDALTLMIINKTGQPLTSDVALSNFLPQSSAQVYRYSEANLNAIVQEANQPVTSTGFTAAFPANSITLMILPEMDMPDLSPSDKTSDLPGATAGDTLTYTIRVINGGVPLTSTVSLTDTVPVGLAYVTDSLTATSGTVDDTDAPNLYWTGVLTPTPMVTVTYAVTVASSQSEWITNYAVITAPELEPLTRSATVVVNGQQVFLPSILR